MNAPEFLSTLKTLSKDDLLDIKGIGDILAQNFIDFTESERYQKLQEQFHKLDEAGTHFTIAKSTVTNQSGPLKDISFCITGTFSKTRSELKQELEALGATVVDTVTSKTRVLLVGENGGSKIEKAKSLGTLIVTDPQEIMNDAAKFREVLLSASA